MSVVRCALFVACWSLLCVDWWLVVCRSLLAVVSNLSRVGVCCLVFVACCTLVVGRCLFRVGCWLLAVSYCVVSVGRCLMVVVCWLTLFATVCCPLLCVVVRVLLRVVACCVFSVGCVLFTVCVSAGCCLLFGV